MGRSKSSVPAFRTSKALGQNFIKSNQVIEDIADAAGVTDKDLVIEIGPGEGALTEVLLQRAGRLAAIELDDRLIPILRAKFGMCGNFSLIHNDVLKVDFPRLIEEEKGAFSGVKIIGNLPYYITSPIIMMLLKAELPADSITIMVQKEVAERLVANPGTRIYGGISVIVQYYSEPSYVRTVTKDLFMPVPKVDSAVIKLKLRSNPPVKLKKEDDFFLVVKQAFSQKRKTLANTLTGLRGMDKKQAETLLLRAGIDPQRRAETLSIQEFADLANAL